MLVSVFRMQVNSVCVYTDFGPGRDDGSLPIVSNGAFVMTAENTGYSYLEAASPPTAMLLTLICRPWCVGSRFVSILSRKWEARLY
jgi:hypothetical protein